METSCAVIRLRGWKEFRELIPQFSPNWAFRGQADSRWVLNNAIERTDFIRYNHDMEAEFVAEFQRGARNYLSMTRCRGTSSNGWR